MVSKILFGQTLELSHHIEPDHHGKRLDLFLKENYPHQSREELKRRIDNGSVKLKRYKLGLKSPIHLKASSKIFTSDIVSLTVHKRREPPVDFNYTILFEDSDILVVQKPGNLPVHPSGSFVFNTLLTHLKTNGFQSKERDRQEFYLVHRIDRETSGLMVIAKNLSSCVQLREQFDQRIVKKKYLAWVHGSVAFHEKKVEIPLGRASLDNKLKFKMIHKSESEGGQSAHTDFALIEKNQNYSLLECTPHTGRQHQIRIHASLLGHPIVGDKIYSLALEDSLKFYQSGEFINLAHGLPLQLKSKLILNRQALHAWKLGFYHPNSKKWIEFLSHPPKDMNPNL